MTLRIDSTVSYNCFILLQNLGNPSAKYDIKRRMLGGGGSELN